MEVGPGQGEPLHFDRPTHGLIFACAGESQLLFDNGIRHTVQAGQVYYLPYGSTYRVVRKYDTSTCIAINFSLDDPALTFPYFSLPARYGEKYAVRFRECLDLYQKPGTPVRNRLLGRLYDLIGQIQQDALADYQPERRGQLAGQAKDYLIAHYRREDLTIDETARALKVTPEHLRKVFKDWYGISPRAYLQQYRLEQAKALIDTNEIKLGEVAGLCGFAYNSYFYELFHRVTGLTPAQYRNRKA